MSCAAIHNISERVAVRSDVGLAYVYFAFSRQQEQTVEHVLGSILAQLLQGLRCFPPNLYDLKDNGNRPTPEQLFDEICLAASGYQQVFIVLDALDECSIKEKCRSTILDYISTVQSKKGVNLLATSRIHQDIASRFQGLHVTSLPISARDDDVYLFLARQLETFDPEIFDEEIRQEVTCKVIEVTAGMFLLAKLHLNTLLRSPTKGEVKECLNNLSSGREGLDEVYDLAMERIRQQGGSYSILAHRLLMWIVHARRPLSTLEIQHALAIQPGTSRLDKAFIPSVKILKSICVGLVTLDEDSDIIRLVHYTAQEYFVKTSKFETANTRITEACVTYLSFPCFGGWIGQSDAHSERLQMHPFYNYAASEWVHHAQVCTDQSAVIEFLKKDAQVNAAIKVLPPLMDIGHIHYFWQPRNVIGLYVAKAWGLHVAAEALTAILEVEAKNAPGTKRLLHAVKENDTSLVKLLLESSEVDVNQRDENCDGPLDCAIRYRNTGMIKLLLKVGKADTSPINRDRYTLMEAMLEYDNLEIIRMALDNHKLDFKPRSPYRKIRGYWHAFKDNGVIETIIEMDMLDNESKDSDGNTPLMIAVKERNLRMVELLLNTSKVNPDVRGEYGWTPLTVAVSNRHHAMIELFLKAGKVNIDAGHRGPCGTSPIRYAIEYDEYDVTMRLLNGAPRAINPRYGPTWSHQFTALGMAVGREWWEVVKLLFEKNQVDLAQMDDQGHTALCWAANEGQADVVKFILTRKPVEVLVKDEFGDTPVYLAALRGHANVVTMLLKAMEVKKDSTEWKMYIEVAEDVNAAISRTRIMVAQSYDRMAECEIDTYLKRITPHVLAGEGSTVAVGFCFKSTRFDINATDKNGKTPLHWAAENGCTEVVELLLGTKQADLTMRDFEKGWEPLYWAIQNDHAGVVNLLLPDSSLEDTNMEDKTDETPMLFAAQAGSTKVVELLLTTDTIDLNVEDERMGAIALHWAVVCGHTEVFSLLLSKTKSGDINAKTRDGRTALHLAAEYSRPDIVKLLLETRQVDLKAKDEQLGWTALHCAIAATTDNVDVAKLLLAEVDTEDINAKDDNGCTPISLNAQYGCLEILELLLETKKVDLEVEDNDGWTPVMWAMERNADQVPLLSGRAWL